MLTKATRTQILGTSHFLAWSLAKRRCPIHICASDLTGLPGADQERVVRGYDGGWSVAGEKRVVWGWGTHKLGPAETLHQLTIGAVLGNCQGLAAHLLPVGPAPALPCWPRARHFGEQEAF